MSMTEADGGYMPASAERTIKPRRGLPSGRAVVGALLVTVAAVGSFAAASRSDNGPDDSYLVITRRVDAGTPVRSEYLRLEPMQLSPVAAANALRSTASVEGATAIHDLTAGDLLSVNDFVPAPRVEGETVGAVHEFALPVPRERIAAATTAGDRVTVLATLRIHDELVTVVAVEDAVVLGWDTDDGLSRTGVLTLALEEADTATGLAHMAVDGEITAVRTTRAIGDEYPDYYFGPAFEATLRGEATSLGTPGSTVQDSVGVGLDRPGPQR